LGSLLLRLLASFAESLQVVTSPCCPRQLPDVISNSLFLDAGSPTPAVHRVLSPVSSTMSSAFPRGKVGRLPAIIPLETTSCGGIFEVADISLCSGLQVCSPPRSFLPLRILPQGSRGFYVRAYRALLPPHAPDMLTVRIQVIDGTGTFTLSDSQPCRLLTSLHEHYTRFITITEQSAPLRRIGTFSLADSPLALFSLGIAGQVLKFHTRAGMRVTPPLHRTPHGQSVGIFHADPGAVIRPRF
jgi:hypothetical protein